MKVLSKSLATLDFFGFCCTKRIHEPTNEFMRYTVVSYICIAIMISLLPASTIYIYLNLTDFANSTNALVVFMAAISFNGTFFNFGSNMKNVKLVYIRIQALVDKGVNTNAFRLYEECEQKCQRYSLRVTIFFVSQVLIGVHLLAWLNAIYKILIMKNYCPETYYIPYRIYLPFDTSTFPGYILTMILEAFGGNIYVFVMCAIIGFYISCCLYIEAFCEHLEIKIRFIDAKFAEAHSKANHKFIQKLFRDAVDFHVEIIEISTILSEIMSGTIFFTLLSNVIVFAAALFQVTMATSFYDLELASSILSVLIGLMWNYAVCYFATRTTKNLERIGDTTYNMNWHTYPKFLAKYLMLIMIRSQKPLFYNGLAVVRCTLANFMKLTRTATSFFLMF